MTTNILNQGLTVESAYSVGAALIRCLESDSYNSFTFISAFASEAGINGLAHHIHQDKYNSSNIIVGVDQRSTSKEALDALLNLQADTYIFHQPGFSIFHPKIYLFEGELSSELIVGSSNLTKQGLFINVEASIHLTLDHNEPADLQVIADLKARFASLFDFSDPNLQPITSELIEQLVAKKIVPTAAELKEIQEKVEEVFAQNDVAPGEAINLPFPRRDLPRAPNEFRRRVAPNPILFNEDGAEAVVELAGPALEHDFELVWKRRSLPGSSVEIARAGTNPTGALRLVQDSFRVDGKIIDQTTYFRNVVFRDLLWAIGRQTPLVYTAIGKFHVFVLGDDLGEFNLEIRHKPSGEAGQANYTTSISWCGLSRSIRERVLTGRILNLYKSTEPGNIFKIEIV